MLFLLNNPLVLIIGLIVVGFMTFVGKKIVSEINYNKMLKQKHGVMRVGKGAKHVINKRMGLLGSAALAPVLVITMVLMIGTSTNITNSGNVLELNSDKDVEEVHDEFYARVGTFKNYNIFPTFFGGMRLEDSIDMGQPELITTDVIFDSKLVYNTYTSSEAIVSDGTASDDYSETNNQVLGVDEMDDVVTDGKFIYTMNDSDVVITLAYTNEQGPSVLGNYKTISMSSDEVCGTNFGVSGLYVDEDYLVVLGYEFEINCGDDGAKPTNSDELIDYINSHVEKYYAVTGFKAYVYDKSNDFELTSEYELSGNMIGTRKIGDNLIIVTNTYIPFNDDDVNVDDYLPSYTVGETTETTSYEEIVYIEGIEPDSFTAFYCLDLDNEEVDMEVVLGDSGYNLYVSNNNIYIVGSIYYFAAMTEVFDVENPVQETRTAVIKVSINDDDLEYEGVGSVVGTTLNQFSMDEYNGFLRIATTAGGGSSVNNMVTILDSDLEEVGKKENLGKPGERIKSVRFVGDYGYMVTFRQTDPFYVIDLTNPSNPTKVGELEIPGFSSYLQPLGNDFMLGIGFGDNYGGTNGIKVSVYDIRDKTNPVVFDEVIFDYHDYGWAQSDATYNHKDLLINMEKGIIALPFEMSTYSEEYGERRHNSGIMVYNFDDETGLEYSGYIQHEVDSEEEVYVYKIKFISDYFYSISDKYIKASLIEDPESIIGSVQLPE